LNNVVINELKVESTIFFEFDWKS